MQGKELAQKRKNELLCLLENSKDKEFKNCVAKQLSELEKRHSLRKTKKEKQLYCKYCYMLYNENCKTRIRGFKKNGKKKKQKVIICGKCGKESRITL